MEEIHLYLAAELYGFTFEIRHQELNFVAENHREIKIPQTEGKPHYIFIHMIVRSHTGIEVGHWCPIAKKSTILRPAASKLTSVSPKSRSI